MPFTGHDKEACFVDLVVSPLAIPGSGDDLRPAEKLDLDIVLLTKLVENFINSNSKWFVPETCFGVQNCTRTVELYRLLYSLRH